MAMKKVSKRTGNRRLLKLAALLEADAKNKKGMQFDIGTVGRQSYDADDKFKPGLNCGTTACAMGLASISGAFKRNAGLSYVIKGDEIWNTINGRHVNYDLAAMRVFGINQYQASHLFNPFEYSSLERKGSRGELEVARRIRKLVAER